jgi:alkylation response protein AidB-like acyl-CoA dehydrogenase
MIASIDDPSAEGRCLRPLLRAAESWCQVFSEPGAGSDLSSLSTRAVRDKDVYRMINAFSARPLAL